MLIADQYTETKKNTVQMNTLKLRMEPPKGKKQGGGENGGGEFFSKCALFLGGGGGREVGEKGRTLRISRGLYNFYVYMSGSLALSLFSSLPF